jgi:hypothetical protein
MPVRAAGLDLGLALVAMQADPEARAVLVEVPAVQAAVAHRHRR